jgi:nitrite reductase (NADH) small subunit
MMRAVGYAADVPMFEGRSITLGDGRRIAVFRTPDGFHAVDGTCPHKGGPLADGLVAESCVTCPLHNRRFDLRTGREASGGPGLRAYAVEERDGRLWVDVPQAEPLPRAA